MAISLFNCFSPGAEQKTLKVSWVDKNSSDQVLKKGAVYNITYEYSLKQRLGHLSCGLLDCSLLALAIIAYRKGWLDRLSSQEGLKRTIVAVSGVVTLGLVGFDIRTWITRPTEENRSCGPNGPDFE